MGRKQYSVLEGVVKDLERALDDGGTVAWKLLSRFDNCVQACEEADLSDDAEVEGDAGDDVDLHEAADGPDEGRQQLELPGTGRVEPDVPRGTLQRDSVAVPLAGAGRPVTFTAKGDRRRGT